MPLIACWPAKIKPGVSEALISQVDFAATIAALVAGKPDATTMPDSLNVLPALLGESKLGRDHIVEHAGRLAIRQGNWKFVPAGNTREKLGPWNDLKIPEPGYLFDLAADPAEATDLAEKHPAQVSELRALIARIRGATPR